MRQLANALLLMAAMSPGDVLHFREGGRVSLPVSREGTDLALDTPMGLLRFPESDFPQIDSAADPAQQWSRKREEAASQGPDDRLEAALWALGHGLVSEAEAMLRESLVAYPDHRELKRLVACLDRLESDLPEPDWKLLLRGLPATMRVAVGPHILLVHEDTDSGAAERVAFLETILRAYYLDFAALGFDLPAPERKLASIVFAKQEDYAAHLRREGATGFLNTRGYHHPTRGVVIAYDCRSDALRIRSAQAIADRRVELRQQSDRVQKMPPSARMKIAMPGQPTRTLGRKDAEAMLASLGRQVDRQEMLLELTRREIDLGVAAHETIHQLVAITKLAPTNDRFPNWLHEGLAMQYETIRGGRWAGLNSPSGLRLAEFQKLSPPPRLEKSLATASLGQGYNRDGYATAWALVHYLRQNRTAAFVAILDTLRAPTTGIDRSSNPLTETLKNATKSEIADEEARWHAAMRALQSP